MIHTNQTVKHNPQKKGDILVVDDTVQNLQVLTKILINEGYEVKAASNGPDALLIAKEEEPSLILLDIKMPKMNGYDVCLQLKMEKKTSSIPVIFISGLEEIGDKVKGFAVGGVDYVTKPFQIEEVLARVETHLTLYHLQNKLEKSVKERTAELEQLKNRLQEENIYLQEEIKAEHNFEKTIGQSEPLKKVLNKVKQVAATDVTVLILGETGTGKELVARAIHNLSSRKDRPLVKINCGSLHSNLIESELFGHEKGSFTGAIDFHKGRFELADTGTIFLDEIGELPLQLQMKLLRVLQEGEFERVGGDRTLKVDVRIIAATNRNLEEAILQNLFRQDLFYRINVLPINVPSLRERKEDIPLLVNHFLKKFAKKVGKNIDSISKKSMDCLQNHNWPGNIRELENVIERAVIFNKSQKLYIEEPTFLTPYKLEEKSKLVPLEDKEREYILSVLEKTNWIIAGDHGAASILGLHSNTLRSRMAKLKISKPQMI